MSAPLLRTCSLGSQQAASPHAWPAAPRSAPSPWELVTVLALLGVCLNAAVAARQGGPLPVLLPGGPAPSPCGCCTGGAAAAGSPGACPPAAGDSCPLPEACALAALAAAARPFLHQGHHASPPEDRLAVVFLHMHPGPAAGSAAGDADERPQEGAEERDHLLACRWAR
jgi:hypothetical protein